MRTRLALLILLVAPTAQATELTWAGSYRARGLLYDSLSLSSSNPQSEGTSNLVDHRFRLQPRFMISDRVALFAQMDALNLVPWGEQAEAWADPVTGEATSLAYDQSLAPLTTTDGAALPANISITRAWGEVYTDAGKLRFGRVPLHWGAGIFLNDGLADTAEYGDTADRIQFTSRIGLIYLMAAWDVQHEGYINVPDDMQSISAALAYRTETVGIGYYNTFRYQPSQAFTSYSGDFWFAAELGPGRLEGEAVGVFGRGNLEDGANDVTISSFGTMLTAEATMDKLGLGLEGGLATGDKDTSDSAIKTFTFDRDHNVALMLFEEPMPRLEAVSANETNGNLELDAAQTGDGIRNALYIRPHVNWQFPYELKAELSLITAQAAAVPDEDKEYKAYGTEVDLNLQWSPYEHFTASGTFGWLHPGAWYSTPSHEDTELGGGFDEAAIGGRLMATVAF